MSIQKTIVLGIFVLFATLLTAGAALAYYPNTPYSGVNTIGTVWQESYTHYPAYDYTRWYYDYVAPPRQGGFFGDTTAYAVGLRPGVYYPVAPTYYTSYYQNVCNWPTCYLGAAGFPRAPVSQFPHIRR